MSLLRSALLLVMGLLAIACSSTPRHPIVYYGGSPWGQASVNGQQGFFLVDTGASVTVIDTLLAEKLGARQLGSQTVVATTGELRLPMVHASEVRFAGRSHHDRILTVQDLAGFRAPGGRRQSGLIGSDFLLEYNVILDNRDSLIALSRSAAPTTRRMRQHAMRLNNGIPEIEVQFSDGVTRWAKFDTGSGYASEDEIYIDVGPDVAEALLGRRLLSEPDDVAQVVSLAGRRELPIYQYGPITLLGREFPEIRLVVHDHSEGAFSRPGMILVTGSMLRSFSRIEIDYPRRAIWVRD